MSPRVLQHSKINIQPSYFIYNESLNAECRMRKYKVNKTTLFEPRKSAFTLPFKLPLDSSLNISCRIMKCEDSQNQQTTEL